MIFVTGGTGLVGSHLIFDLLQKGYNIRALRRKSSSLKLIQQVFEFYSEKSEELLQQINWVEGDLLDIPFLEDALEGVTHIYHSAAFVSFHPKDRNTIMKVNVEGTANLVNIAMEKNIKKFGHISSIAALGRAGNDGITTEDSPWKPSENISTYSRSKFQAENEVWRGVAEGLNAVIINPSVILGPGEWSSSSTQLFKTVRDQFPFYTKGVNGYVDVRDVSKSIITLMESDIVNERFVVNSENLSYQDLLFMIADSFEVSRPKYEAKAWMGQVTWRVEWVRNKIFNTKPLITKETARTAYNKHQYSSKKIQDLIDYKFIPIEQSVRETCHLLQGLDDKHSE